MVGGFEGGAEVVGLREEGEEGEGCEEGEEEEQEGAAGG